jgi:hypothetical protein
MISTLITLLKVAFVASNKKDSIHFFDSTGYGDFEEQVTVFDDLYTSDKVIEPPKKPIVYFVSSGQPTSELREFLAADKDNNFNRHLILEQVQTTDPNHLKLQRGYGCIYYNLRLPNTGYFKGLTSQCFLDRIWGEFEMPCNVLNDTDTFILGELFLDTLPFDPDWTSKLNFQLELNVASFYHQYPAEETFRYFNVEKYSELEEALYLKVKELMAFYFQSLEKCAIESKVSLYSEIMIFG